MAEFPHSLYNNVVVSSNSSLSVSLRYKQAQLERSFSETYAETPSSLNLENAPGEESSPDTAPCTHHLAENCQVCVSTRDDNSYFRHLPYGNYSLTKVQNEPSGLLDVVYDQTPSGFFTDSPGTNPLLFANCTKDKPASYRYKTTSDLPGVGYGVLVPMKTTESRPLPSEQPSQPTYKSRYPTVPILNVPASDSSSSSSKSPQSPSRISEKLGELRLAQVVGDQQKFDASNTYNEQFRLLEQQNKRRLALAKRQRDDAAESTSQETQEDLPSPKRQSSFQYPPIADPDNRHVQSGFDPSSPTSNMKRSPKTSKQRPQPNEPCFTGFRPTQQDCKSYTFNSHLTALEEYQMQIMLLEQEKHRRRVAEKAAREEEEVAMKVSSLKDYQKQIMILERQNQARLVARGAAEGECNTRAAHRPNPHRRQCSREGRCSGPVGFDGDQKIHNLPIRQDAVFTVPDLDSQDESEGATATPRMSPRSQEASDMSLSPTLSDDYVMIAKENDF